VDLTFHGTPLLSDAKVPFESPPLETQAERDEHKRLCKEAFEDWHCPDEDCHEDSFMAGASAGAYFLWKMIEGRG
jgi:hypothetical protein